MKVKWTNRLKSCISQGSPENRTSRMCISVSISILFTYIYGAGMGWWGEGICFKELAPVTVGTGKSEITPVSAFVST